MLLQELYQDLADRCSMSATNAADQLRMRLAANNQLRRLFTKFDIQSNREVAELTTVAATHTYYLDRRVLRALNFRETNSPAKLDYMSRQNFEEDNPNPAPTETGVPSIYVPMRKVRVTTQPTAASQISVVSDSALDIVSYYVVVKGLSNGVETTERLLLTGIVEVVTTATFDSLLSITKDATNGTVRTTSNAGVVLNVSLQPGETFVEHWEVRLHQIPNDAYTIPYSFQCIPWTLSNDEDPIHLPDVYSEAFLALVAADVLFRQGDKGYTFWKQEGERLIQEVMDMDFLGEDNDLRFGFTDVSYGVEI